MPLVLADPKTKFRLRQAAEKEEHAFYSERVSKEWLAALLPLEVDENKAFLEEAPYVIAIFAQTYGLLPDGTKVKNYYVNESVGIAAGILITAIHRAGLASLTHTPIPMGFIRRILNRPANERPFLLLVVGYPHVDAVVPEIRRKTSQETVTLL